MLTIDDIRNLAEMLYKQISAEQQRENLAEKDQLHPVNYWLDKLGINRSTLWHWERQGRIKATRLGSRVYFRQSDFDNLK